MANKDAPDLYGILGIPEDSPQDEIKRAYRKLAKEHHPDIGAEGLSQPDRETRMRRMQEINEAYSVLSNPEKRQKYESLREGTRATTVEGVKGPPTNIVDLFNELFGTNSIFREGFLATSGRTEKDYFLLPENDLGLLAALVKAYKAEVDGKWKVKKSKNEEREWIPIEIYLVKREGGKVYVYRRIDDWRNEKDRSEPFQIRGERSYDIAKEIPANHFLGEYYLAGKGRDLMRGGIWVIPGAYARHLTTLKSLAKKLADGNNNISQELSIIEGYSKDPFNKVRLEGNLAWDDPNNELVRNIKVQDLSLVLKEAESRVVQVEGSPKAKEGQVPDKPEKLKPKPQEGMVTTSGETEGGY